MWGEGRRSQGAGEEVLEQAAEECSRAGGPGGGDRRRRAGARQAARLISSLLDRTARFDLLVNNAGGQFFSPAELIAPKGWQAVWRLNVEGMLNMSERAHELAFSGGRGGTIVNVTLSPHHGMPGMAHSGAARATVEALTRSWPAVGRRTGWRSRRWRRGCSKPTCWPSTRRR